MLSIIADAVRRWSCPCWRRFSTPNLTPRGAPPQRLPWQQLAPSPDANTPEALDPPPPERLESRRRKKKKSGTSAGPPAPSHFIALQTDNADLVARVTAFQDAVVQDAPHLRDCCVAANKLHISLLVLHLTPEEVPSAVDALRRGAEEFRRRKYEGPLELHFQDVGTFSTRVLFGECTPRGAGLLRDLNTDMLRAFCEKGLAVITDHKNPESPPAVPPGEIASPACSSTPGGLPSIPSSRPPGVNPLPTYHLQTSANISHDPRGQKGPLFIPGVPDGFRPRNAGPGYPPERNTVSDQTLPKETGGGGPESTEDRATAVEEVGEEDDELVAFYDRSNSGDAFVPHLTIMKLTQAFRKLKKKAQKKNLRLHPRDFHHIAQQQPSFGRQEVLEVALLDMCRQDTDNYYRRVVVERLI